MEKKGNKRQNRFKRILFISLGTFFVGLGLIGIVIPVLPTTPFLLLSAALYAKSSDKFYNWLINNRLFGKYIKNYRDGRGIPLHIKVVTIVLLWGTIGPSIVFAVELLVIRIFLVIIAIGVTVHIVLIKKFV